MKWNEIRIKTTEEAYDAISEMLISIGSGGVAIEDPNEVKREIEKPNTLDYADDEFLNSLGEDITVKAYFPKDRNIKELVELVKEKLAFISNFLDIGEGHVDYTEMDEHDWANEWKKYYKPDHITDNIVIKPTWEQYDRKADEIVIELDPGMAFGTGTHETTRMCARLLSKYVAAGDRVIDVGCGTGILSIIAAKLGAEHVTAVDIDSVAVKVAKENCSINHADDVIDVFAGVLTDIDIRGERADIIAANIIANVIIDIAEAVPRYIKKDGYFITSGIIRERKQEVINAYVSRNFALEATLEAGEWVAMAFRCLGSL